MTSFPALDGAPPDGPARQAIVDRVAEILELRYRSASLGNFDDPLEEAVYIILSRQTTERAYQEAHRALRSRWPSWTALRDADAAEVADVIKPAGLGPTRAMQLKALLGAVTSESARRGLRRPTLDWLKDLSDDEAEAYLVTLPGIGPKSARCILHYSLDRQAFAVDTHIRRVLDRLQLVSDPGGKVKHGAYEAVVPARLRQSLHVNLIHHGRRFCRAQKPLCGACPLVSFCETGRANVEPKPETPVAVELFAGGGGLGEGFTKAGFAVVAAVEHDRAAAQTYRLNHPGTVVIEADATTITRDTLVALVPSSARADVVIAGPPCQGYSAAGRREAADEKNRLFSTVVELARELRPRWVCIENVPGIRKVQGHAFEDEVLAALRGAGYNAESHLLRACDYGVPQLRKRIVFLGCRGDLGPAPAPPAPTHCPGKFCADNCGGEPGSKCGRIPTPRVEDVLADLPALASGQTAEVLALPGGRVLYNASTMAHAPHVVDKIRKIEAGKGPISYRRLHRDIARTIVAGHRALPVHPFLDRTVSVREAARIQGFPDEHIFAGPKSQQPLQVANAVPPGLARAVAAALLEELRRGDAATRTSGTGGRTPATRRPRAKRAAAVAHRLR
jgi:DNA (cytosine-5)-methyltransferase 1